jgi:hypothetical protein
MNWRKRDSICSCWREGRRFPPRARLAFRGGWHGNSTVRTNVACEVPIVQAAPAEYKPVEVVIVHGYRNTLRGQLSKAIDAGISIGNNLVVGAGKNLFGYAPLDGSNSALNTWRTYQNIHNLGSYRSTLDGVEAFGKNGTVGGALFENFRNPSALGFAGAALEVVPLLRMVPSAQTISRMGANAEFSVPAKALEISPEGPLLSIAKAPTINVTGPRGISGPGPFAGADTSFTIAGGVNFQVAVPTARVGSAAESTAARTNFNVYEALSQQPITGNARASHRVSANRALYSQLGANPDLAKYFNSELGTDVMAHMTSGKGRALLNPPSAVWHHPAETPGVMQLLRKTEHTNLRLQPVLHPEGIGGFGNFYGN